MASQDFLDIKESPDGISSLLLLKPQKQKTSTFRPDPSSALLRAKAFLPQLASANVALEERLKTEPKESVDVEHIEENEENVIEMNVAVYEGNSSDDEGIDEQTDDSDTDEPVYSEVSEANIKLPSSTQSTMKPAIQVLSEASETCDDSKSENPSGMR